MDVDAAEKRKAVHLAVPAPHKKQATEEAFNRPTTKSHVPTVPQQPTTYMLPPALQRKQPQQSQPRRDQPQCEQEAITRGLSVAKSAWNTLRSKFNN